MRSYAKRNARTAPPRPNDMGIAKLHFQIGAGQGQWAWGDGGLFIHK